MAGIECVEKGELGDLMYRPHYVRQSRSLAAGVAMTGVFATYVDAAA
jgi:hypothetical protein